MVDAYTSELLFLVGRTRFYTSRGAALVIKIVATDLNSPQARRPATHNNEPATLINTLYSGSRSQCLSFFFSASVHYRPFS